MPRPSVGRNRLAELDPVIDDEEYEAIEACDPQTQLVELGVHGWRELLASIPRSERDEDATCVALCRAAAPRRIGTAKTVFVQAGHVLHVCGLAPAALAAEPPVSAPSAESQARSQVGHSRAAGSVTAPAAATSQSAPPANHTPGNRGPSKASPIDRESNPKPS